MQTQQFRKQLYILPFSDTFHTHLVLSEIDESLRMLGYHLDCFKKPEMGEWGEMQQPIVYGKHYLNVSQLFLHVRRVDHMCSVEVSLPYAKIGGYLIPKAHLIRFDGTNKKDLTELKKNLHPM